jgi:iron(III) transport system substrate-binding protein
VTLKGVGTDFADKTKGGRMYGCKNLTGSCGIGSFLRGLLFVLPLCFASPVLAPPTAGAQTKPESLDELYEKVKKEGGKLTLYVALSSRSSEVILAAFKKRFPAVTIDHIDATSDKLVTRAITEARAGRVVGDVFGGALPYIAQMAEQKLLEPLALAEAAAYPTSMKSRDWVATDAQFFIVGWNTGLVKKGEEPRGFEDLADPKWKGALMGEPRDYQVLMGLAKQKYNSDEKAIALMKRIAANQAEFHRGHSQLVEFLVAGQRAVCFTCYSHHFPPRIKKGAPLQALLTEGVGEIGGSVAIFKGAPHPHAALLWARWAISEEGQRAYAEAGETPTHPKVEPKEKTRPVNSYMLTVNDVLEFSQYQKLWKGIFGLQ